MNDLTVMPVVCWEEWCAVFHTTFREQSFSLGGACEDIINMRSYEQGLAYLRIILKRDKYKNNLALGYTVDFLTHFQDVQSSSSSTTLNFTQSSQLTRTIGLDIVRFSSQMADMSQKKNTKSINSALGDMGMKEHDFIAEVRHALTHKALPNILLVKRALVYLIQFLYETYWLPQYTQLVKSDLIEQSLLEKYLRLILASDKQQSQSLNGDESLLQFSQYRPQQSQQNKQLKRMGNIVADNVQTFRRRLNEIGFGFIKNYDGERDFVQIDNLKKKKQHLTFFLSELLRIVLNVVFYARQEYKVQDKDAILVQVTRILTDMLADAEFKKTFAKINDVSFLKYKLARISLLQSVYEEITPLLTVLKEVLPIQQSKKSKSKTTVVPVVAAPTESTPVAPARKTSAVITEQTATSSAGVSGIELNKFGAFRLKTDHIPSLLGKKMLETL